MLFVALLVKVVVKARVGFDVEHRCDVCAVRLKQVIAVAKFVNVVEAADKAGLLNAVEYVAAKAEQGVMTIDGGKQAWPDVGVLHHYACVPCFDNAW